DDLSVCVRPFFKKIGYCLRTDNSKINEIGQTVNDSLLKYGKVIGSSKHRREKKSRASKKWKNKNIVKFQFQQEKENNIEHLIDCYVGKVTSIFKEIQQGPRRPGSAGGGVTILIVLFRLTIFYLIFNKFFLIKKIHDLNY
ncbi:hypothetical protein BpHYR1_014830, partial [Brachionus plicatilis]